MGFSRVPNPATLRTMKPVEVITDRAKRYRARANPPQGPEECSFCSDTGRMDVDHIDGYEDNDEQQNKMFLCRSCNGCKGKLFARLGHGKRTRQFNPQPPRKANPKQPTFLEYCKAALVLTGKESGSIPRAVHTMQNTSPGNRRRFVSLIRRAARKANPGAETIGQYVHALHEHRPEQHDAGGAIIHATPKWKRREYAADIWKFRKEREREAGKTKATKPPKPPKVKRHRSTDEDVPF